MIMPGPPSSHSRDPPGFLSTTGPPGITRDPACWRLCRYRHKRHTFATRALEQCATQRDAVARHFVALATYLGHADIAHTYWYFEATPELMRDIAAAAEALVVGEGA